MVIPAIIVLGPSGLDTARKARRALGHCELHGLAGRVDGADISFTDTVSHIGDLFAQGRTIIGICASGILIRAVSGRLGDKRAEPPIIALADDGSVAVPLLGGHHGANELARRLAGALGGVAAITTAGDVRFSIALDEPPAGWTSANPVYAKAVMAKLLAGDKARLTGEAHWLAASDLPFDNSGGIELVATYRRQMGSEARLIYHPHVLALGVGCERGIEASELIALVDRVLLENDLAPEAIALVASIDLKADEAAIHALADHLARPARFFDAARLAAEEPRLATPSDLVRREVGVAGVAEAAALAAAGHDGVLIVAKQKSARATCAVTLAPKPIDVPSVGQSRGRLVIVGTGPGDATWLTPEARQLLQEASDWVGYDLYLDLIGDLHHGQREHRFPLGAEEDRVRHALELAGQGRAVALVSSGDPGIYAMATLAYELLDGEGVSARAKRVEIVVAPGISAFQAAAARAGAPMGHDFCLISLSDLLTPWSVIEQRLVAAAQGDFVTAFYNPRSQRRRDQIERAFAILSRHRPADTPVIIAANLGRPQEKMKITTLGAFDPDDVDMLTIVIVGASQSKILTRGDGSSNVYTPRGYAAKREQSA